MTVKKTRQGPEHLLPEGDIGSIYKLVGDRCWIEVEQFDIAINGEHDELIVEILAKGTSEPVLATCRVPFGRYRHS